MRRRDFLRYASAAGLGAAINPPRILAQANGNPGFHLTNVTAAAGIDFQHNSGAYGGKFLPETLGSGCAFLDYDADGWQDILLVNGMDWPGHRRQRSTLKLYKNNRNGTFTDVTKAAGLDIELYGMGVAAADYNNDGFPDIFISCVGQSRLFHNTGKGTFLDVTKTSGLLGKHGFSTSALWFDYDRDGLLDLFVCNYVRWSPEQDVFCSLDGTHKSYCTPEAYRGDTCWLFHNRGNGTFEDVTATSGIFDSSSKSLGVAMFDYDQDGWPDLLVANDTQPNKLYKNLRNGKFKEVGVEAGLAFSNEGKARAGMGIDTGDFENTGKPGVAITNFDNEMIGLYQPVAAGSANAATYDDIAIPAGLGAASRSTLGFGCAFFDANLDGWLDLAVANGHIDETVRNIRGNIGYAQPPQLFLNSGAGKFHDVAAELGGGFDTPIVGRGLAYGDFDRDGDLDLLITTNNGPAYLYRNDQTDGNRSIRFRLIGTKS
ncbi:MAG: VCBS repeat-containing protein, partial [Candidatus Acidiferrum sp.]